HRDVLQAIAVRGIAVRIPHAIFSTHGPVPIGVVRVASCFGCQCTGETRESSKAADSVVTEGLRSSGCIVGKGRDPARIVKGQGLRAARNQVLPYPTILIRV